VGDTFKVGVEPISPTSIPPSNIYNFYRGKYLKFITGRASGFKSLITDYRVESESLSVFTLSSFSGILPQQGDTFQIVSDRRWYATLESPFSTTLPAYPAYQEELPETDLQFSSNTIYSSNFKIPYLALSDTNDIVLNEYTGTSVSGYDIYKTFFIRSIDSLMYFWDTPILTFQSPINSGVNGVNNEIFSIQPIASDYTTWTITSGVVNDNNTITYTPNVIPSSININFTNLNQTIGYIKSVNTTNYNFIVFTYVDNSTNTKKICVASKLKTDTYPFTNIYTSTGVALTVELIVHDIQIYQNVVYIIWSTYDASTLTSIYYSSIATSENGAGLFSPVLTIYTSTNMPIFIRNLRSTIRTTTYNNDELLFPVVLFDSISGNYQILIMVKQDIPSPLVPWTGAVLSWRFPVGSSLSSSINYGILLYTKNTSIYIFTYGFNNGLFYYSIGPRANFLSDIPINQLASSSSIQDVQLSNINNNLFLIYSYLASDGKYKVVSLNSQQFQIANAVPYRIRKNPSQFIENSITYETNDVILTIENINLITTNSGVKDIFYYAYEDIWYYMVNNSLYTYPENTLVKTFTEIPNPSFVKMQNCLIDNRINTVCVLVSSSTLSYIYYYSISEMTWKKSFGFLPTSIIYFKTQFDKYNSLTNIWGPRIVFATSTGIFSSRFEITDLGSGTYNTFPVPMKNIVVDSFDAYAIPLSSSNMNLYHSNEEIFGSFFIWNTIPITISGMYTYMDIAFSPSQNLLVVTTDKTDPNAIDFLLYNISTNVWSIAYQSTHKHTNHRIQWNDYFSAFIATSTFTIPSSPADIVQNVVLYSQNGSNWIYVNMYTNTIYDNFDIHNDTIGLVSEPSDTKIQLSYLQPILQTNRLPIDTTVDLVDSFIWVYNREYLEDTPYKYILNRDMIVQLPFRTYFELLSDIEDCFNGINYPFNYNGDKCYSIAIQDIILPNKTLSTYLGNQISFYPYIYVKIVNEGSNTSSNYSMITNNPNATTLTFKIPVSQFTNDPSALPYIRLSSGMTIKAKFNLRKSFRFTVYLPNGDVFQTVEQDNITPDFPNPLLQISATLRITDP
jgi:hypothetical protein